MRELALANSDKVALVDDVDYDRVVAVEWKLKKDTGYAYCNTTILGTARTLHRTILGLTDPKQQVDHIDRQPLNCQRNNLRICTNQQNCCNRGKYRVGTGRFKGVCWSKQHKCWRATLTCNYKQFHVGSFDDDVIAAHAYDFAAIRFFGEFASLNFPEYDYSDFQDPIKRRGRPTSKYPGVHKNKHGIWIANLVGHGKKRYLGSFKSEKLAIEAVRLAKEKDPICQQS